MAVKTRDKIIETARRIYNERRYGNVTLAELADELKIAKGNLWYHFREKRDLLEALTDNFLDVDKARRQIRVNPDAVLDSYLDFLWALAGEIRDYRFLFRDQADYGEHTDVMLEQLPVIYDDTQAQFCGFFRVMKKDRLLEMDDNRIETLALNAIIILRYGLEFIRERRQSNTQGSGAITQIFEQHLALFDDNLEPDAAAYLRTSFSNRLIDRRAS